MRSWLLGAALSACYVPPPVAPAAQRPVSLRTPFEPSAVAWADAEGTNRVEGTALLRTRGGEPKTCAALNVGLIPDSTHARERLAHVYKSHRRGFNPAGIAGRHPQFSPDDARFYQHIRKTKCDADGRFEFRGVPDGEWFVVAEVTWEVPGFFGLQGGALMQRISVSGGETVRVILTEE